MDDDGPRRDDPDTGRAWDDLPAPRDEDAPDDDGLEEVLGRADADDGWDPDEDDDDLAGTGPGPAWPDLGAIPPALARPTTPPMDGRPVPGLLDVTLPWSTLAGHCDTPGLLGRIGPITAEQARHLARQLLPALGVEAAGYGGFPVHACWVITSSG